MNQSSLETEISIALPGPPVREIVLKPGSPARVFEASPPCQPLIRLMSEVRKNQRAEEMIWLLLAASAAALVVLSLWM